MPKRRTLQERDELSTASTGTDDHDRRPEIGHLHQNRLESLGEVTACAVNGMRLPLATVLRGAEMLAQGEQEAPAQRRYVQEILACTTHVSEVIQSLATVMRLPREGAVAPLSEVLDGVLTLAQVLLARDNITLKLEAQKAALDRAQCDQRLQQVVLGLLLNAREAINDHYPPKHPGRVIIVDAREVFEGGRHWLLLSVEDHGAGIPEHLEELIFEPLFTTRTDGHSGLGLAAGRQITEDLGGRLELHREPGSFTRFDIFVPHR